MDVSLAGRLETDEEQPHAERVIIRNISSHGARVVCARPWRPHEHVHLSETIGDFHLDAEVVYCERLSDSRFAIGLRFGSMGEANAHHSSRSYW